MTMPAPARTPASAATHGPATAAQPTLFGKLPIGARLFFNPQDVGTIHEYEKAADGKLVNCHTGRAFRQRANQLVWTRAALSKAAP